MYRNFEERKRKKTETKNVFIAEFLSNCENGHWNMSNDQIVLYHKFV